MIELLQIKNKGVIVLCNAGNFYISVGKDAITLNEILDLKLSCFKPEVCKVGFPLIALEKYTNLIEEKDYSYIVYNFNRDNGELQIIKQYKGKNKSELEKENVNCYICKHSTKYYKNHDIYVGAVAKLYESEIEQNKEIKKEEKDKWFKIKKKKKTS